MDARPPHSRAPVLYPFIALCLDHSATSLFISSVELTSLPNNITMSFLAERREATPHAHLLRPSTFTSFIGLLTVLLTVSNLLCLNSVKAADEVVRWAMDDPQGGKPYDQLQCQRLTVNWVADGRNHSLYEFDDEVAYKNCDFNNAWLIVGPQTTGMWQIRPEDSLIPTKRFFGSGELDDCSNRRMKFSVKVRPLLQDKFPGYECDGGFDAEDVAIKSAEDIKACRKICKRRKGCVAIMHIGGNKQKCRLYKKPPFRAIQKNANTACEVATTSCDPNTRSPVQVVAKPEAQKGCVFCNNHRSPDMLDKNRVCDSCPNCLQPNCKGRTGYCEFTCWISGYNTGKRCCDISTQEPDDGKDCQECTNHRTQWMVENGRFCNDYSYAYANRCSNERTDPLTGEYFRSWWLDAPVQYCQYSCEQEGVGFQGKTLTGDKVFGEKKNQYPQTFDNKPCCPRSDETDPDVFPVSV